jgi:hypothetical protein
VSADDFDAIANGARRQFSRQRPRERLATDASYLMGGFARRGWAVVHMYLLDQAPLGVHEFEPALPQTGVGRPLYFYKCVSKAVCHGST